MFAGQDEGGFRLLQAKALLVTVEDFAVALNGHPHGFRKPVADVASTRMASKVVFEVEDIDHEEPNMVRTMTESPARADAVKSAGRV